MAHAVRFHQPGGPDVLRFEEVPVGDPGPGEVRLRQTAVGLNLIDTYHRGGLYPVPLPSGLGLEAAGVVEAVGEGVDDLTPGDRVAYATGPLGAYAAARVVSAAHLVPLPQGVSEETAAASLLKGMTVEYLIRRTFRVEAGMTVLFHAAAGGVGLLACQWLSHLGVKVIGTVGSAEKVALAQAAGCAEVLILDRDDVAERVRALTGGAGVPVAYDSVGKATFDASLASLARRGMLVSFGNASGKPAPLDPLRLAKGSLFLTRPTLFDYTATREELLASAAAFFDVVRAGAVRVDVHQRWPLAEAAAAHRAIEARETVGSTVLVV